MTVHVAVVDYGSGNLRSVANALEAIAGAGTTLSVTADAALLKDASHVILPGVGAFAGCMAGLRAVPGMLDALQEEIVVKGKPFLGICVGMQLLAARGEEDGDHAGLGWIGGAARRLTPADPALKIPHMGWNTLEIHQPHPLTAGLLPNCHAYFVHSYALGPGASAALLASADYGGMVPALVAKGNIAGCQFHPEKSQRTGLTLLSNFLHWRPHDPLPGD